MLPDSVVNNFFRGVFAHWNVSGDYTVLVDENGQSFRATTLLEIEVALDNGAVSWAPIIYTEKPDSPLTTLFCSIGFQTQEKWPVGERAVSWFALPPSVVATCGTGFYTLWFLKHTMPLPDTLHASDSSTCQIISPGNMLPVPGRSNQKGQNVSRVLYYNVDVSYAPSDIKAATRVGTSTLLQILSRRDWNKNVFEENRQLITSLKIAGMSTLAIENIFSCQPIGDSFQEIRGLTFWHGWLDHFLRWIVDNYQHKTLPSNIAFLDQNTNTIWFSLRRALEHHYRKLGDKGFTLPAPNQVFRLMENQSNIVGAGGYVRKPVYREEIEGVPMLVWGIDLESMIKAGCLS
jgi:hypothetical protein